jgi:hypothetical protein
VRRRALIVGLLGLTLIASAAASTTKPTLMRGQRDGTYALQDGRGSFALQNMQGSVLGRFDRGKLTITAAPTAGNVVVRGASTVKIRSVTTTVYSGKNIRFHILGGKYTLQIDNGVGVQMSVVGQGRAMLLGAGYAELGLSDGEYSLNDAAPVPVPDVRTWVQVQAPPPPPHNGRPRVP